MLDHWQQLIGNFAVVALFISTWVHGQSVVSRFEAAWRSFGLGLWMGAGAVATMLLGIMIGQSLFDLRLSLIAIAGFFGGPIGAIVAALIASSYRILFVGGLASLWGACGIIAAACVGVAVSRVTRGRLRGLYSAMILSVSVAVVMEGLTLVIAAVGLTEVGPLSITLALLNAAATALACTFIMRHRNIERERDLLRAAFLQAPDVQYIKTIDSRFAVVNEKLAWRSGVSDPAQLIGRSDFDILHANSAAAILVDDQTILRTGVPKVDFEELVHDPSGDEVWYLTSKVPLRSVDGETIGLAGWTRDITARKRLERDVVESRNQLSYVLAEMTDGIAMFDRQGTLVYCNNQYRAMFHLTSDTRRSGQHIRDILRAVVETAEQLGIPAGREAQWIDEVAATLGKPGDQEVQLKDGRWLRIKTRPTRDGSSLVVVSEISQVKEAEQVMQAMTEQLKLFATTDGLTGLSNRRAFDQALDSEMARCRRSGEPLALLLIDVDRFKSYNDQYGHPEGDRVLKVVAQCLTQSLMRPGDVAARYGGEEFVAILPGTSEDGAFFVADNFRETLAAMRLPHVGGDKGYLTASVGLAMFEGRDAGINPGELVRRADEALYNAKGAGRDRVLGWRARHEIRPSLSA